MGGRIAEGCPGVGSPGPCIGEGALANPGAEFKGVRPVSSETKQLEVVPRKASKLQFSSDRTANRHRWAR